MPNRPLMPLHETIEMIRHGQHDDCRTARQVLGVVPRPLEDTVRDAHAWFLRHGYLGATSGARTNS